MKTHFLLRQIVWLFVIAVMAVSCLSDENLLTNESEEAEMAELSSVGENESDDVLEVVNEAEMSIAAEAGRVGEWDYPCATVTNDTEANIITIDFGTNCVGPYGRTRSGKVFIAYSGEVNDGISNRIITFENYTVNNKEVTGQIELRDIVENEDGTLSATKKLIDLKVAFPNGASVTYNGSLTRLWTEGVRDGDTSNNVFEITGSVQGIWSNGRTFTHTIVEPIISKWSCAANGGFARVAGVVEVQRLSGFVNRTRITDYGDGECDNMITITIGQRVYTITLSNTIPT
jgi:hypothetical protein